MKKLLIFLALFLCVLFPASAEQRVFDEAKILSAAQQSELESAIESVRKTYDFDVVLATVPNTAGKDIRYFAADFYDYGDFGAGDQHDGIILLIATATRQYTVVNTGRGNRIFGESALDDVEDAIVPSLRQNQYSQAMHAFVQAVAARLEKCTPLGRANAALPFLVLIGAAVGLLSALILKGQMKSVRKKTSAHRYVRKGSFHLTRVQDVYLYTTTTRTRIETSSGSRGGGSGSSGGFTGSSGTFHTGRSGSF